MSSLPNDRRSVFRHPGLALLIAAALLLLGAALATCQTQSTGVLCRAGDGNFDAEFRTGVKVHVGAARSGGVATLATRSCAAKLSWEKQELAVVTDVAQLDLDAFGVDFGDGVPAAAFQFKKSDEDCCMEYRIYSLEKPPRLLRTVTGGDFYSASDVDLDGRIEIWTHDAAAANGFEELGLSEMDFPPTVVLRLEHGQFMDVSSEFQSYFDGEIAKIKAELLPQDREAFKASAAKLTADSPNSAERLHRLRLIKIKVLEIVWAYLYSGRDDEGWRSLAELWPTSDLDRIRSSLLQARTQGIRHEANGVSAGTSPGKKKRTQIFEASRIPGSARRLEIIPPKDILLELPPVSDLSEPASSPAPELLFDLIIDAAGKVRAAEPAEKTRVSDPDRMKVAFTWKFVPAFKDGRPVASRLRIAVSPRQ
jgi:hypothetical protein